MYIRAHIHLYTYVPTHLRHSIAPMALCTQGTICIEAPMQLCTRGTLCIEALCLALPCRALLCRALRCRALPRFILPRLGMPATALLLLCRVSTIRLWRIAESMKDKLRMVPGYLAREVHAILRLVRILKATGEGVDNFGPSCTQNGRCKFIDCLQKRPTYQIVLT